MPGTVNIKLWDGRTVQVQETTLFAEKDQYDNIFYKVQGRCGNNCFMIGFSQDLNQALALHMETLELLIHAQTEALSV